MKNYTPCIACFSEERELISQVGRNFTKLNTVICKGCGLIHSDPIPTKEELDKFYKKDYRIKYKHTYRPQLRHTIRYSIGCLETIKEILSYCQYEDFNQKRFLDIGSGSGEILFFAKKIGFDAEGIEPNKGYSEFCTKDLGLKIKNNSLEEVDLKNNYYDIINLNQVLEHLPNPIVTLKGIYDKLKDEGLLVLTVPDIEANLHSPNTRFHYAHIYNYNHLNLKKIFDNAGFHILNPSTNSTRVFAKKTREKNNESINFDLKRNYFRIRTLLNNNDYKKHYLSKTPYIRFINKCYQYSREIILSFFIKNHKQALENTFNKNY